MDDYDIELTPNDPEFGPDECESAYALWAFKEDGEPVKFLEASLVEDPDYPSGYSFSWRSLSCDRTGKLVEGEGGVIGDVSRADYVADMVLPGGAVFSQVEDEYLPSLPYSFEKDSLSDSARKSAAEAIRGAILSLPLSVPETTEAIPAFYRLDNPAMPDDPLTRDMLADALQSVENYHRGGAIDALLCNRDGMSVAKQALIVSAAKGLRSNSGLFDAMSRAVGLIRATEGSAAGVSDCALAQSLLITGFHHMQNRCFDTVSRGLGDVRYMDISKAVKIFAEELTRDTGLALDAALKGKYAMRYGRDVDALIFTDADIDEYAELLGNCCADLDPEQRSKAPPMRYASGAATTPWTASATSSMTTSPNRSRVWRETPASGIDRFSGRCQGRRPIWTDAARPAVAAAASRAAMRIAAGEGRPISERFAYTAESEWPVSAAICLGDAA